MFDVEGDWSPHEEEVWVCEPETAGSSAWLELVIARTYFEAKGIITKARPAEKYKISPLPLALSRKIKAQMERYKITLPSMSVVTTGTYPYKALVVDIPAVSVTIRASECL